jgi:Protein of unknown function (DUF1501)
MSRVQARIEGRKAMSTSRFGTFEASDGARSNRRDFLRTGTLGTLGLGLSARSAGAAGLSTESAVILLMMVGGPSQIETFDPKPDAPSEVRGPFRSIETAIPGVRLVEHLPGIARRMDRLTLVRSLHHNASPIHETGLQLLGTGNLFRMEGDHPHLGSLAARRLGSSGGLPPFVILPGPIGPTGVSIPSGQSPGSPFGPFVLGDDPASPTFDPRAALDRARRFLDESSELRSAGTPTRSSHRAFDLAAERASTREAYGRSSFGQSCLLARRLVESGVRVVVVNMAETVFGRPSWDAHGREPFSTFDDYARNLLPTFDRAFSALVDDLESRDLLASTLVVASGELGRTPKVNASGGRDHWPGVWSALLAGGGTQGGRVIGASDRTGSEPSRRPVTLPELFATMSQSLGLGPIDSGSALPIAEAFA